MPPAIQNGAPRGRGLPALLGRIFAAVVAVAVLVVGFMFSLAIFAVALVVGLLVFGWLWWKLRRAVRQMRGDPRFQQFMASAERGRRPPQGDIIEGEVIREEKRDER